MNERLVRLLLRRRWVVLGVAVLVTAALATLLPRLSFDNTIETWFVETDPDLAIYDHFTETFRADQVIVVGLFANDVFTPEVLAAVDRISTSVEKLRFTDRVRSVTQAPGSPGGFHEAGFREAVLESPLLREQFLSPDLDATAIVIHYAREGSDFVHKDEFVRSLRAIAQDAVAGTDARFAVSGGPVLGAAGQLRNKQDMRFLVPVMVAVIVIIAFGIFQSVTMTLLPLGVSSLALIAAYGLMAIAGWQMTMISVILIPLVLAVGIAHAIHIIDRYRWFLDAGNDNEAAVVGSVSQLLRPCFFAGLTTVIGLLSLLVSDLRPVQEFAVTAAFGVSVAFVASVTILPVVLSWRGGRLGNAPTLARQVVRRLLAAVHLAASGHPRKIVTAGLLIAAAFGWLATRVDTGVDTMSWIRHDDPIRVETQLIDNAFGGALSLEFLLRSPEGRLGDPDALRRIESFQYWLVENTLVARTVSMADLVKESARLARDEGEGGYALPRTRALTSGLLDKLRREGHLDAWVTDDFKEARIAARLPLASAQDLIAELPAIRSQLEASFGGADISAHMTGLSVLAGKMQTDMLDSQVRSFGVALGVVSLVMIVLLRSSFLGLLAMIPNLLPIALGLGAMTLLDIRLSPATVMIAAIALGIVVDDTVHLMTAFERRLRQADGIGEAVRSSLLDIGQPVMVTSILLATGFATLVLGSFLPTREVGGIVALIVVAALLTDIVFLPAILRSLPARWLDPGRRRQSAASK